MLYCENCQVLSAEGEICPLCGGKKLRPVRADDPVFLFSADEAETSRITAAFDDEGIPHMERNMDGGAYVSVILGQSRCVETRIFVPYSEIEHAKDVLRGIGALKDDANREDGNLPEPEREEKTQEDEKIPMSRGKRIAVRIFSALVFIFLIWAVVSAADSIVTFLKNVF